jgi:nitrite reductase (NO-forming)
MWNAGVVMVAVGVPLGQTSIVGVGGASVAVGLVLFAAALRGMQRRSLQQARWAVRWYQASAFCLGAGALIGVAMARGAVWSAGSLLGAHLTLNIAGWMGTAIVGTLHTFFPSLTHTRLRLPRLQGPAFVLWTTGVWILAGGVTFGLGVAVVVGWLGLGMASALLSVNLLASSLRAPIKLALPARLIAAGQLCLPIGIAIALETTFTHGAEAPFVEPTRSSLAMLLLMGWVGLTVAGSLLHLLAVLARVRQFSYAMPGPRPVRDQSILGGAGVAVVGLTVGRCVDVPVATVICGTVAILVAGVIGLQLGALLLRAVRPIRRRRSPDGAPSA